MESYEQWLENREAQKPQKKNVAGGFNPTPKTEEVFKHADLITLPADVKGTNCFNCRFLRKISPELGFCEHHDVEQYVNERMCCKYWDNQGVKRTWGEQTG